ncbi:Hypothetical predicted protein [Octopus vulgaris]|uniref:Uncharacterized protein n=3 Tax=Octopus TaxID=6643 RepID=A0AA36B9W6_OCTVU|nr:TBC1 domain family member 7 [Octopus bimaculoides]XP_036363118.1 TBC1 domain family member 7 [Octopus sinensis]XP_036363119.1 TBC1 domain family member 7 [Octopus sinensis]CAI9730585.1 Hypothetical predicted protein [Octopus vulgaris]|eukprot:XP_014786528.1 PREDICTED: TBC1 domain family member 7-like [Octopus bimaculoides]
MADEKDRNFRVYFYNKFGMSAAVESKKYIESFLKEERVDIEKLKLFVLKFPLPSVYRLDVWKVLLGVWPAERSLHKYAQDARRQTYTNLFDALRVMERVDDSTPLPEVYLKMHLLNENLLPLEDKNLMIPLQNRTFCSMSSAVINLTNDPIDQFWITAQFYRHVQKCTDQLELLPDAVLYYLKLEEANPKLCELLQEQSIAIPLSEWFQSCFAGVLPESSFERIWDKVIGGRCMVLVYVAVSIFIIFQQPLLNMKNSQEASEYFKKISVNSGDVLVNKALSLFQKYST